MISIITSLYNGFKAAMLEKDYQKGSFYILEAIAGLSFLNLIILIVIACQGVK